MDLALNNLEWYAQCKSVCIVNFAIFAANFQSNTIVHKDSVLEMTLERAILMLWG